MSDYDGILSGPVQLHNIRNVEAVIAVCIRKSGLQLSPDEWDELLAEGLLIVSEMATKFEPHRDGYEQGGSFYGYVMTYLPRKLGGAWHRTHETHVLVSRGGKRKWVYYDEPASLDETLTMRSMAADQGRAHTQSRGEGLHDGNCRTLGDFVAPPVDLPA